MVLGVKHHNFGTQIKFPKFSFKIGIVFKFTLNVRVGRGEVLGILLKSVPEERYSLPIDPRSQALNLLWFVMLHNSVWSTEVQYISYGSQLTFSRLKDLYLTLESKNREIQILIRD